MKRNIYFMAAVLGLLFSFTVSGMAQDRKGMTHRISADFFPSYVLPTNPFFKGVTEYGQVLDCTMSAHLKYSFNLGDNTDLGRLYPNTFQGLGLSWNTFFNTLEVGTPVALYLFQNSPILSFSDKLHLNYEWNFGISYGWKTYDIRENRFNRVVGSKANAYINLGVNLEWEFAKDWRLYGGIGFTHFSNGNTGYPNAGVNSTGGRIGLSKDFHTRPGKKVEVQSEYMKRSDFYRHMTYDLVLYGAARKRAINLPDYPTIVPGVFAIAGLNFNPMYNFSRYLRAGLSADFQFDESANIEDHKVSDSMDEDKLKFYRPPFREQAALGISLRGELVMPFFSINLGIGRNIICKGKDTNCFYQTFALKADVYKDLFIHIGYQLFDFKNPNNLMLDIGYRFNNRH